jgi:hypothetical protein
MNQNLTFYLYYAECRCAECRHAECRYAECRGVITMSLILLINETKYEMKSLC